MPRVRSPEWQEFVQWLTSREGKPMFNSTAATYCNQVRRILREVGNPTPTRVDKWLESKPGRQRTPFRCAWRAYLSYLEETGKAVPFADDSTLADAIKSAIVRAYNVHKAALLGANRPPLEEAGLEDIFGKDHLVFLTDDEILVAIPEIDARRILSVVEWAGSEKLLPISRREVLAMIA